MTFLPLRRILILLVAFDVPLTGIVFVETVILLTGSLINTSAFVGGGASLSTAVIFIVFETPSPGVSIS